MNEYQIALVVIVNQRGADASDAVDRAIANLSLKEGQRFTSPQPLHCGDEAGSAEILRRPTVIMTKPLAENPAPTAGA